MVGAGAGVVCVVTVGACCWTFAIATFGELTGAGATTEVTTFGAGGAAEEVSTFCHPPCASFPCH